MATKKVVTAKSFEEFLDEQIRYVHLNDELDSDDYNYLLANLKEFVENQVKLHQLSKEQGVIKS